MEIRYENLCADPLGQVRAATEFAGLPWSPQLERNIALLPLTSQNDKWKQGLSPAHQEILTDGVRQSLAHWGYHA
jgi:hypothetical protein